MKKIDERSLVNSLKNIKNRERKWDIILLRLLNEIIGIAFSLPILVGLSKLTKIELNWVASISTLVTLQTISTVRYIIKGIKERKNRGLEAEGIVRNIVHKINLENEKNANNLVAKITFDGIKDAVTTKEVDKLKEDVPNNSGIKTHTKETITETTYFFLLDNEDKLKVLKEIKKEIFENNDVDVNHELYLLDDEENPSYVPVVKTLRRK